MPTSITFLRLLTASLLLGLAPLRTATASGGAPAGIQEVRKIWDAAPHNAFTDLAFFRNQWYCTFREGSAHVSDDGRARLLVSDDGVAWRSAALFTTEGADLRGFHFSETPDGALMLFGPACEIRSGTRGAHVNYVTFSDDGRNWSALQPVADRNFWLWEILWKDGTAYGLAYKTGPYPDGPFNVRMYRSPDGQTWETAADEIFTDSFPNETAGLFLEDGTLACLVRRDLGSTTAQWGLSAPPHAHWTWHDVGQRIGSPLLRRLPDGRLLAPIRLLNPMRTVLCWVDPARGTLTEFLKLPSSGDNGYCGAVLRDGVLWVSYYSSHEGKASIYLAKVRLPAPG